MLDREDYWQCAYVIPKGRGEEIKSKGLAAFREEVAALSPFLRDRVEELRDWKDISLLTVRVDRLARWYRPGLLCIGDAAHAMSPIGGVGINLAIQDAVAAANILSSKLRPRNALRGRSSGRPAPANISHAGHAAHAIDSAEQRDQARPRRDETVIASLVSKTVPQISLSAPLSCARGRRWISSGAHQDGCAKNEGVNLDVAGTNACAISMDDELVPSLCSFVSFVVKSFLSSAPLCPSTSAAAATPSPAQHF